MPRLWEVGHAATYITGDIVAILKVCVLFLPTGALAAARRAREWR